MTIRINLNIKLHLMILLNTTLTKFIYLPYNTQSIKLNNYFNIENK